MRLRLKLQTLLALLLVTANAGFCMGDPCGSKPAPRKHVSWDQLFRELKNLKGGSVLEKRGVRVDGGFYANMPTREALKSLALKGCVIDGPLAITGNFDFISFDDCIFNGPVSLYDLLAVNGVSFSTSCFKGLLSVRNLNSDSLKFNQSGMHDKITIRAADHLQKITLDSVESESDLELSAARDLWIYSSSLRTVNLTSSTLDSVDIVRSRFNSILCNWCYVGKSFFLWDSTIERSLDITQAQFRTAGLDWPSLKNKVLYSDPSDLDRLDAAFHAAGMPRNLTDALFYTTKKERYKFDPWYVRWWDFVFFDLSCGFGVKPLHTLPYAFGWILIFGLCYCHSEALVSKKQERNFEGINLIKRVEYGILFSITCFFRASFSEWEPSGKPLLIQFRMFKTQFQVSLPHFFQLLAYSETVLSWFLLALFLAAYLHTMSR